MDTRLFRDALGQFATGVCLITLSDQDGQPRALTANSFSSVSLDPPLVLWSLQKSSEVYALFAGAQRYAICVLNESQEALSVRYAIRDNHLMLPEHYTPGANGAPLLKDALASFECDLFATHDAGDHTILIGQVSRFELAGAESPRNPLLFYSGRYGRIV